MSLPRPGYFSEDTVVALASPPGGAICVLRISGPKAIQVLSQLCSVDVRNKKEAKNVFRADLKTHESRPLDDALCVYFLSPKSYTGEDLVEISLHGSSTVATAVLEEAVLLGARQALPGEFSFRAVKNGKMTVVQAQAVADLVASTNRTAAELALEKLGGSQAKLVLEIAENLRTLCSMGELGIDFADQDVEELSLESLKKRLRQQLVPLERLVSSFERGSKIQEGVSAVFIGLPNAGKSSFFNALLGEDRSIVSDIAGTTRDVIREKINLTGKNGSVTLRLEDTAGIRSSSDQIEKMGIERTIQAAKNADLLVLIVDLLEKNQWDESIEAWKKTGHTKDTTVVILTKKDKSDATRTEEAVDFFNSEGFSQLQSISSETQEGISEASSKVVETCTRWTKRAPGEVLLTRIEQVSSVKKTLEHLDRALSATEEDLFAADVRHALSTLGPVIGETLPDDILGRIFSRFCIGK